MYDSQKNGDKSSNPLEVYTTNDKKKGGERADFTNIASDETPKTIRDYFKSFFYKR